MKTLKILSFFILLTLLFGSCGKEDTTAPTINITSPTDGQVVKQKTEFKLTGTITDDTELSEINLAGNKITSFTSKTSHTFNQGVTLTDNTPLGNITIEITATDKAGNKASKTIALKVE